MKRRLFFALLAIVASTALPQQRATISGKVVDTEGNAVEYATVGIPSKKIGTLTGTDGVFTLDIADADGDTLLVTHVSYENVRIPVNGLQHYGEIRITLDAKELAEAVIYPGKRKSAKLAGKGTRVPGAATKMTAGNIGNEIGSIVETKRPFEVQEIEFNVTHCNLKGARLSINIYKADSTEGHFHNALCKPVYVDIPTSNGKQKINVTVDDRITLDAGRYFVSVMLVDYARYTNTGHILFPLYLKSSYIRNGVMDELESIPVNMGLTVKGVEYR